MAGYTMSPIRKNMMRFNIGFSSRVKFILPELAIDGLPSIQICPAQVFITFVCRASDH